MEATCLKEERVWEAHWANTEVGKSSLVYGLITGVDLTAEDIYETLGENKKLDRFRGFRQIFSHNPSVDPEMTADELTNRTVFSNMRRLETEDVSFELHIHPH